LGTRGDTSPVVEWLADGARSAPASQDVLAQLCDGLLACGIPLARAAVFVQTLHPDIMGRSFRWRPGEPVAVAEAGFEVLQSSQHLDNPSGHVRNRGIAVRRRLADPGCPMDYPLLHELRADGITDYFAAPLRFTNDEVHFASFATLQPGGFTDAEFAGLEAVINPLARIAEIRALRRTAGNLLNTYVGRHAGERILAGQIRRGHTETIHAALWLSDMRGFTPLADSMAPARLIGLLDRFFDCQVEAIHAHEGEVLKFIGDGLFAIFPTGASRSADDVCRAALAAARAARERLATFEAEQEAQGFPAPRHGLALHLGEVLYGNIGGADRLDFTCIGPAVNLAARMEKLTAELGRRIVASREFAAHCGAELTPLGEFALRGFGVAHAVFGLPDESGEQCRSR